MSKEFEERVLQKLDAIEKQVAKLPEIEKQVAKLPEIEKQIAKIPNLEKQINRMPEVEEKINNMNRVLILLENELKDKFPVLFDGYSMNQEKQDRQQEEIDSLSQKVNNNDIRISVLEQKIG